jgi:hypothetical protein
VAAIAGDDFVLTVLGFSDSGMTTGIGKVNVDGTARIICSERFCRRSWRNSDVFAPRRSIWEARHRGCDTEHGTLWSKQIPLNSDPNDFQFGQVRAAMSANVFAVWITAHRKALFDGVHLGETPTLFGYEAATGKRLFTVPVERNGGDFDFALSPHGSRLAIFDGARFSLYTVHLG